MRTDSRPVSFLGWPYDDIPAGQATSRRLAATKAHGDALTAFIMTQAGGWKADDCRSFMSIGIPPTDARGYNCAASEFCTTPWPMHRVLEVGQMMREYIAAGQLELGSKLKVGVDVYDVYTDQSMQPLMLALQSRHVEATIVLLEAGAAEVTNFVTDENGEPIVVTSADECVALYAAQANVYFNGAALARITEVLMNRKITASVGDAKGMPSDTPSTRQRRNGI